MRPKTFVKTENGKELATLCLDLGYKLGERVSDLTRHQINFLMAALNRRREIHNITSKMADFGKGATTFIFED